MSCDISAPIETEIIARVGENTLIKEDIINLVPDGLSKDDSIKILTKYIDNWALNQLIRENAELNLSEEEIEEITKLSEKYYDELHVRSDELAEALKDYIHIASEKDTFYDDLESALEHKHNLD